jgi:hypothetical protein
MPTGTAALLQSLYAAYSEKHLAVRASADAENKPTS